MPVVAAEAGMTRLIQTHYQHKERIYMKINFNKKLKGVDGEDLKNKDEVLTLLGICTNALLFNEKDENIEGKEKVRRFKLAHKVYGAKEPVSVEVEDVVLIKELVANIYSTLIVGQVWELLESNQEK